MSVKIDGKDLGQFIKSGLPVLGGKREYRGEALEDKGKKLEAWLRDRTEGMNVEVVDTKFPNMRRSVVLQIDKKTSEWKGNIFHFTLQLKEP